MTVSYDDLLKPDAPPWPTDALVAAATAWERAGRLDAAATALDQAWSRDPGHDAISRARARVLDALAFTAHGMTWRYVPAGPFVMGTEEGEDDESPPHTVVLGAFWMCDVPVSWERYCALSGLSPPPHGAGNFDQQAFRYRNDNKIRRQYCGDGDARNMGGVAGSFDEKPMVAVSWSMGDALGRALSTPTSTVRMPTEAEWEKAARGGLAGARYPWGDTAPTPDRADHARFEAFSLRPSRACPPNAYGIFHMAGGVWEWTVDDYDAEWYAASPARDPRCAVTGDEKVLRGGSWADCATVLRVTFRMSRTVRGPDRTGKIVERGASMPNVGLRLVWVETPRPTTSVGDRTP